MLHFVLGNASVDIPKLIMYCDNCPGQNKNRFVLWYLVWCASRRYETDITLNFLIEGHKKSSCEVDFGLVKRWFSQIDINSPVDSMAAIETSSVKTSVVCTSFVTWMQWNTAILICIPTLLFPQLCRYLSCMCLSFVVSGLVWSLSRSTLTIFSGRNLISSEREKPLIKFVAPLCSSLLCKTLPQSWYHYTNVHRHSMIAESTWWTLPAIGITLATRRILSDTLVMVRTGLANRRNNRCQWVV